MQIESDSSCTSGTNPPLRVFLHETGCLDGCIESLVSEGCSDVAVSACKTTAAPPCFDPPSTPYRSVLDGDSGATIPLSASPVVVDTGLAAGLLTPGDVLSPPPPRSPDEPLAEGSGSSGALAAAATAAAMGAIAAAALALAL